MDNDSKHLAKEEIAKNNLDDSTKTTSKKHFSKTYKLLLIDDEESCLTALEMALFNTEYEIIKTSSGTEGVQYLTDNPDTVDIILLDLMMPEISGLEVIQALNKINCKIPIIIQTASYNYSDISKALKYGAKSFLSKPFDKKLLLSVLSKTFASEDVPA